MTTDDERWQAVKSRAPGKGAQFWYGVMTTGVFCRPVCTSRRPRRENVRFFGSPQEAVRAGLRPCKRCLPEEPAAAPTLSTLLTLCRHLEGHPEEAHTLSNLASRSGLSQFQIHRLFKAFLQITPRAYLEELRIRNLKRRLRQSTSVTDAIYDAGFESISAVYGRLDAHLGMTPKRYRAGGSGVEISFAFGHTALGPVLIGATDRGVCYAQFGDSERELLEQLSAEFPQAEVQPSKFAAGPDFEAWMQELNLRISGSAAHSELPLDITGTAFQKRVWDFLQTIPSGDVMSYGELATAMGAPRAARAVARACAGNRIGVLVPCHRVLRGSGELGGYRWGVSRKRALIDAERSARRRTKT